MNTPVKRGRGRPTLYSPQAVELAAQGLPLTQVATRLGVTVRACTKWMDRHAEFREAVERGRALARQQTHQRQQERAEAKRSAKQSARAAALNLALHEAGLIPNRPMSVVAPEPERPQTRTPITSTGYRAPGAPRWHDRQRAKRGDGSEPTATPRREARHSRALVDREPGADRELPEWYQSEIGDGEPFPMLDPRRHW